MGKSKARSSRQTSRSASQRKAASRARKSRSARLLLWLGTLGTAVTAVLVGVLVNVLSTQAQRVVPPPSPGSDSAMPHLEVDGISLSSGDIQGNGGFKPFKIDIKLLNTGKGVAAINDARL